MIGFIRSPKTAMLQTVVLCSLSVFIPHATITEGPHHFLGTRGHNASATRSLVSTNLLMELETTIGRDHRIATESRVARLENVLRPMFASMPKDTRGRLDATGVRYLLHRLFVQRHGWFITGLSYDGDAWSSSSPATVFKGHADDHHELFHNQLSNQGFSLHQVAVFGATLEVMVHAENIERLRVAYDVLGFTPSEIISESETEEVMSSYMMMYVLGKNHTALTPANFHQEVTKDIHWKYPMWPDTKKFSQEVRLAVLEDTVSDERSTWASNLKVLEEIGERYGRWQNRECHDIKQLMMAFESAGNGRVSLEEFYRRYVNGDYQFSETIDILRMSGSLDESDPDHKNVIISNYINSPGNCLASSKFYSVCCINECEALMASLENNIASPDASPARILELVSALPSDTAKVPRTLSTALVQRLEEISAHHNGRVPLHGRLFSQWMHHAYPLECPYPHLAGTTKLMTDAEAAEVGIATDVTESEARAILKEMEDGKKTATRTKTKNEVHVPWHQEEELFVPIFEKEPGSSFMSTLVRGIVLAAVLFAFTSATLRTFPPTGMKAGCSFDHKYCV